MIENKLTIQGEPYTFTTAATFSGSRQNRLKILRE